MSYHEALAVMVSERVEAAHRRGVTGVPAFARDGYSPRGAVPPEQLVHLIEGVYTEY
ncbi:putative dithiol-disulfide isomerase involved in polyketide biosynthesis [Natranaeroarchaeum sulfidigenes]|uniref:Putative dithiol-disulfide isomerase involved in polyketide biosynthesis n=1 Tax=Natranaeroarchaeum sulfidigenes TaxID=2784880 RepID=A0A897MWR8_9EURY|nr:hypothetical protein [Natranaeroarchaeum sulfidigenes]QSG03359.1 putative dithiol-disulfide isomerase involved in polyketide biosynthesis [Natranaeroarchaeum sulfidigenes]